MARQYVLVFPTTLEVLLDVVQSVWLALSAPWTRLVQTKNVLIPARASADKMPIAVSIITAPFARVRLVIPAIHSADAILYLPRPQHPLNKTFTETPVTHRHVVRMLNAAISMVLPRALVWQHM